MTRFIKEFLGGVFSLMIPFTPSTFEEYCAIVCRLFCIFLHLYNLFIAIAVYFGIHNMEIHNGFEVKMERITPSNYF